MQSLADPTLGRGGPHRLLLVDDNPGDARLISELLKDEWRSGTFDLSVATSLVPALQILQREPPDVLLLDLSLPDSWGLDTLRRVQAVASGVASIVLAGPENYALALEAVKEGAQDFLFKNDLTGWLLVKTVQCASERKRIESRLRISEARFRSLAAFSHLDTETQVHVERFTAALELSADAIFFVDRETLCLLDVSAAACKVLGYERQELLGLPLGALLHRELDRTSLTDLYDKIIVRFPEVLARKTQVVRRDGAIFPAEVQLLAIQAGGRWVIVAKMRDLTERNAAQKVERFRAAMDVAGESIFLADATTTQLLDVNETLCIESGYSREELLSMCAGDIRATDAASQTTEAFFQDLIACYPQQRLERQQMRRADGQLVPMDVSLRAMPTESGWIILASLRNIAERMEAQRKLELFRTAMDHSPDSLILVDRETMLVLGANVTAQRRLGLNVGQLALPLWAVSGGSPDALERAYDGAIAMAPEVQVEFREILSADGRTFPAEIRRRALQIDGRWVIVSSGRDMTELQQRINELARSNEELERFAYVVSHDMSEPLRMIASYAKLLERRYMDRLDGDALEFMEFIVGGARRLGQLLHDLLEHSRAGRNISKDRPIDLNRVLRDVLSNLRLLISEKGAAVDAEHLPTVRADRTSMIQLLQNLVGNALKFQKPGTTPRVRISAVEDSAHWTVSAADNGIGIAPEHFERIFVIFQRLHTHEAYAGTGIGLSICKKIVESHGGRIGVHSEPDVGTTFWFTLPKDGSSPSAEPT